MFSPPADERELAGGHHPRPVADKHTEQLELDGGKRGGRGLTALVAAGIILLLVVSAVAQASPPRRRIVRRVAVGAGAFALLGAGVGAMAAWSSVRPLRRGLAEVSTLGTPGAAGAVATTSDRLESAQRDFA
ncbi:MAG: hypothetical protein M3140_10970, partial [Actinomycetota bacterium]|nr:hypothetical protein [Actinomycetota bacterium]